MLYERFDIEGLLGQGGAGEVYRAYELERLQAAETLTPETDPETLATSRIVTPNPENGFVPQTPGEPSLDAAET